MNLKNKHESSAASETHTHTHIYIYIYIYIPTLIYIYVGMYFSWVILVHSGSLPFDYNFRIVIISITVLRHTGRLEKCRVAAIWGGGGARAFLHVHPECPPPNKIMFLYQCICIYTLDIFTNFCKSSLYDARTILRIGQWRIQGGAQGACPPPQKSCEVLQPHAARLSHGCLAM